jgi:L,D-transpeptidase ErfK/SrfK
MSHAARTRLPLMVLFATFGASLMVGAQSEQFTGGRLAGAISSHVVVKGETLRAIGARLGVDARTIAVDNGLDVDAPLHVGRELRIDARHLVPPAVAPDEITINLPQRLLFVGGSTVTAAPVAVGSRGWPTPLGEMRVVVKEVDPTWDVPQSIHDEALAKGIVLPPSVPPGPDNPLGRFWLGLSRGGVGIHGTNAPGSIYGAVTHGCVRLHPDDIAALFPRVTVGTVVRVIYEPVLVAAVGDDVFLEVHPDVYRRSGSLGTLARAMAHAAGLSTAINWAEADRVVAARAGVARVVTRR